MADGLLIDHARLVDRDTDLPDAALLVRGGRIARLLSGGELDRLRADGGVRRYDAGGRVVMPAFVDMHAHFRDPGQTQKEDIETGSRAAAAGGFGTVVLMPNTSPVVSSAALAEINRHKGELFGYVSVIQGVSITRDFDGRTFSHLEELDAHDVPLVSEDGREVADSAVMLEAMRAAARKGLVVACHCEDPALAAAARPLRQQALALLRGGEGAPERRSEAAALLSRANALLALAEDVATFRNIRLAATAGCRLHLCHVSTARCVQAVREARARGQSVTFEVTPHHLALAGEGEPGVFHIVNPPLRGEADRAALVAALLDGTADAIATDHAPHTSGDKASGSPGFSGLETAFAACCSVLCRGHGMPLPQLSALMSARPAAVLGQHDRGLLRPGCRADLAVVEPDAVWTVRGADFYSRGTYTPLEGRRLAGRVAATFRAGEQVFPFDCLDGRK